MTIKQKPFTNYRLWDEEGKEKPDTFTVKFNKEERESFEKLKYIIQQEKDSTAIKQLALNIGSQVLLDGKVKSILKVVMNNYRKNKRTGVVEFDKNETKV